MFMKVLFLTQRRRRAKYSKIGVGARRSFTISFGRLFGHGARAKSFTMQEVKDVLHAWMTGRAAGLPFLIGQLSETTFVYAWPEGPGKGDERGATFAGKGSVVYDAAATDEGVIARLDDLAVRLGDALRQTHVYVAYGDLTWVIEVKKSESC